MTEDSPADRTLVITRAFNAPRDLVFDVWTTPAHLAQWWGPHGFTNPLCEVDLRVGGAYRVVMRGPAGTEYAGDYPVKGVFLEIARPSRLVMTDECSAHPEFWQELVPAGGTVADLDSVVTVTFDATDDGNTRVTISTLFKSKEVLDIFSKMGTSDGWTQSLEKMEAVLARLV